MGTPASRCCRRNECGVVFYQQQQAGDGWSLHHGGVVPLWSLLLVLVWIYPIPVEGLSKLRSADSLNCLAFFLKAKDLSSKQNTIFFPLLLLLKELLSLDQKYVDALAEMEGVYEVLINFIREPICPSGSDTKSSLTSIFYMILPSESSEKTKLKFVELGLVSLLLEFLVDAEKSLSEKALGILDGICDIKQGREKLYENALSIPLLVKKILRVSELATEFSLSILLKLCKDVEGEEEDVRMEAMRMGAFQKTLVLLQIGCGGTIKGKVTELLKLFSLCKHRLDCVDPTMDFQYLKKSF